MRSTLLGRLGATTAVASLLLAGVPAASAAASSAAGGVSAPRADRPLPAPRQRRTGAPAPATTASSVIDVVVPLHVSRATSTALGAVAHARVSVAARQARLQWLAQRTPQANAVRSWAESHGFTVVDTTPYSVTVHGRAGALAAAFGTTLTTRRLEGKGFVAPRTTPRVPAELAGVAGTVVGLDTRPIFRSHAVYGGGDVQVLTSTPVRGAGAGAYAPGSTPAAATVATVNLAGWHAGDLATYRKAAFGPNDTPPASIPPVVLAGAHSTATVIDDDYGLSTEVALDAEAIAGVAPSARQRMYFGANSSAGYLGVLTQMATDAAAGAFQTASTSWGACELAMTASELSSMAAAIHQITSNGATFFAASGDDGAYGCGDGVTPAVDFPASAPDTVAVGGTSVSGSAPSYTSTGWNGSGGGCSQYFTTTNTPTYTQELSRQAVAGNPCVGRAVPDIANLADPHTGYWVYDHLNEWIPVGGTSLAAPASAAGLATAMAQAGLTKLPVSSPSATFLAKAYANPTAFTDVTTGDNGLYRAGTGYDLVTGLGTPTWTALEAALTGLAAPAITGYNEPLVVVDPSWDPTSTPLGVQLSATTTLASFVPNGEPLDGYAFSGSPLPDCSSTIPGPPDPSWTVPLPGTEGPQWFYVAVHTTDPGAPSCLPNLRRPVVVDSVSPTVPSLVATFVGPTRPTYRFSWTTADASPSSGLQVSLLTLTDVTTPSSPRTVVDHWWTTGRAFPYPTSAPLALVPGHAYRVQVDDLDGAWNIGSRVATFVAPYDDRSASLSSGWSRVSSTNDYMASHLQSSRAGSYVQMRFTGKTFTAGVVKSRYGGYVDVYVDGVKKLRYSLYASSTLYRQQVRLAAFTTRASHVVMLKVVGAHASGSLGSYVYLDSYTVA